MKAVVITGTSSGIGKACALRMAGEGWRVYAGVRADEDGKTLAAEADGDLRPVILDVTSDAHCEALAERVSAENGGRLDGLVNNAGVYLNGPLEYISMDELRTMMAVNVVGLMGVTRALLPALREAGGRIVNISSISGLVALPGVSGYAASKHAVEAITDSLRVELEPFGVRVSAVEPGSIETEIWRKGRERDAERDEAAGNSEAEQLYAPVIRLLRKLNENPRGIPPERVAEAVEDALTSSNPDNRYLVGKDAKGLALLRKLPDAIRDKLIAARAWRD
jgi:NAD(P)-dependent dehydrogenase (short-subunit alcohol dehydrogenase family)